MINVNYIPIPVQAAKDLAVRFHKHSVVILAWDDEHELTHTTTYGVDAFHKENAAAAGRIATQAIGMDLGKEQTFEDFHKDYDPARYKAAIELLNRIVTPPAGPSTPHRDAAAAATVIADIARFLMSIQPKP